MRGSIIIVIAIISILRISVFGQGEKPDTLISLEAVDIIESPISKQAYTIENMDRKSIEVLPAKDVGALFRSIPNVNGIRKGGGVLDPVVRGFKYSQLNVQLNDGQKIEGGCPNRMDPANAHIDVDDISSLEIIKGPFALKYGPNFGGVINMKTIQPLPQQKFKVNVGAMMGYESNWAGFKQRLSIDGGNDKVFFSLSGNLKKYGNYKDGDGNEVKAGFEKYNYTAQLGISPFKDNYLIVSFDQSYGRNVLFPALPMDEREDNTNLVSLDYKAANLSESFKAFNAKVYLSDVYHVMDNKNRPFSDTVVAVSDITARVYGFRVDGEFLFGKNEFVFGTDYEHILKDGTRTKTKILEPTMPVMEEDLWNDADIQNNGIFVLYRRELGRLLLDAAARVDFNRASSGEMSLVKNGNVVYQDTDVNSSYTNFSASLGGRYHFSDKFSLMLSIGRGVRSPDMNERFIMFLPIGYDNYDYLGNPQLKPEVNHEADLSASLFFEKAGSITGGFFFSYVTDYITGQLLPESVAKPQTTGVYGVKQFYNEDYVYLRGFELSYQSPADKLWGVRFQAACTRGINPQATKYIIENGEITGTETITNDPLPEIPPLEGSVDFLYKFFKAKLIPAINVRMVAPQNNVSQAYNEIKSPGFVLLNFNLSYNFNKYLKVTGGVSNIFDKYYYEYLNRQIIGGKGFLYEPGRMFYVNLYFSI
jgi:iron complex outermembrane receptor protein